jgi:hypothetical protein
MKKLLLLLLPPLFALPAQAQVLKPTVGPGTTFSYNLELHGQHAPFEVTVASATDSLKLTWRIRGLTTGAYVVSPVAWQQANQLYFAQPTPTKTVRLPSNQTYWMLSKKAFAELVSQHHYTYDNTTYDLENDAAEHPLLLHGQPLDVLHVVAQGDPTELWILNNKDFPVICQVLRNPLGVNVELVGIK